jgi:cellulose synthase/poly-beta-1,6-N-acetylglucosamine synthase-like glycosyltransferase
MELLQYLFYGLLLLTTGHSVVAWVQALRRGIQARRRQKLEYPDPNTWPQVAVIVPAWRERGTIERCIESLRHVEYPNWQIVIVAGGDDGTYEAARIAVSNLHATVIEQPPRGKNAALNMGLRATDAPVLVFLDADSQVTPHWLKSLVAPLLHGFGASNGNPLPLRPTSIAMGERMEQIASWEIHQDIILQGSGSIAVRRDVLHAVGGLGEEVVVGVDWDLSTRLAIRGIPRAASTTAVVYTERPSTIGEYWRNEVRWRRAHVLSLLKNRRYFFRDLVSAITSLYLYALAWGVALSALVTLIAIAVSWPIGMIALQAWALLLTWILARRAALCGEVAAYYRSATWLKYLWVPPLLLCVTLGAACLATLSLDRITMHFKGVRTAMPKGSAKL